MKILIETDCAARGEFLEAGKVYELDGELAAELVRMGRAVEAPAEDPAPRARKPKAEAANGAE